MLSHPEILERNRMLRKFFTDRDCPVEVIDMNINAPSIIWNGQYALSAYVKNFTLYFTNSPQNGSVLKAIHLGSGTHSFNRRDIDDIIIQAEHRRVYRIRFDDSGLYLTGYNYIDKEKREHKYPVFARHCAKYYFSRESASRVVLENEGYELEIV